MEKTQALPIKEMEGVATSSENKESRTFRAKWSEEIETSGGFTEVPNLIMEHLGELQITASEFLTLTAILSHKWGKNQPWPSNKTISLRTNCTPRTVRKHVESLEKKGILKRVQGIRKSNVYDLSALKLKLEGFAKNNPRPGQKESSAGLKSTGSEGSTLTPKEDTLEEDSIIKHNNNSSAAYKANEVKFLELINEYTKRNLRVLPNEAKETLRIFSLEEIEKALQVATVDPWHKDKLQELNVKYLSRASTIDSLLSRNLTGQAHRALRLKELHDANMAKQAELAGKQGAGLRRNSNKNAIF
jgi:DNA-binding MarR family transcriptional regulator/protein-tyrosine-phosphatase